MAELSVDGQGQRSDPVKAAARALDLFEAFSEAQRPLTLTELAQRIGAPMSSCHALVRTLRARGYLYYPNVPSASTRPSGCQR